MKGLLQAEQLSVLVVALGICLLCRQLDLQGMACEFLYVISLSAMMVCRDCCAALLGESGCRESRC